MIVWIAKLDRDLTSGSAPAFEVDLGATLSEAIARGDHLAQGGNFKSKMMQLSVRISAVAGTDQGE
jgi:hypothetical protein